MKNFPFQTFFFFKFMKLCKHFFFFSKMQITLFTQIVFARNLFCPLRPCKQIVQYFSYLPPPPLQKNNGLSLIPRIMASDFTTLR